MFPEIGRGPVNMASYHGLHAARPLNAHELKEIDCLIACPRLTGRGRQELDPSTAIVQRFSEHTALPAAGRWIPAGFTDTTGVLRPQKRFDSPIGLGEASAEPGSLSASGPR